VTDQSAGVSEREALARLRSIGEEIVDGVERCLPAWVECRVRDILDAWARLDEPSRRRAETDATAAGTHAAARVAGQLRDLFALDPAEQRVTPLEVVRSAVREPTEVLRSVGVPPVVRDAFDERTVPDDVYGLTPRTLGDLGDESLAPLHLAWGLAKAAVLRSRAERQP